MVLPFLIPMFQQTCDDQINECEDAEFPHQCHEQATCTDTIGSYSCTCNPGWEGAGFDCTDIDFCASFPCEHNGTCEEFSDGSSFNCICDGTGYEGDRCEIEIDECSDPDLNQCNQNCTNAIGGNPGYTCFCEPGYFLMDQFTCQVRLISSACVPYNPVVFVVHHLFLQLLLYIYLYALITLHRTLTNALTQISTTAITSTVNVRICPEASPAPVREVTPETASFARN